MIIFNYKIIMVKITYIIYLTFKKILYIVLFIKLLYESDIDIKSIYIIFNVKIKIF